MPDKFVKSLIKLFRDSDFMLGIKMMAAIRRNYQNIAGLKITAGVQTIQPNLTIIRQV